MTKEEIYAFLNAHPLCSLATVEDNAPYVRGMMLYRADEQGIVFHASKGKDVVRQLEKNPAVELCTWSERDLTQVRVHGTAEMLDDPALKKAIVEQHHFLQPVVDRQGDDVLVVFRVKAEMATVWMMNNVAETETNVQL